MRILNFAILFGLVAILVSGQAIGNDLAKIETTSGRTYVDILILDADKHGLMFRHSGGIAKIGFPFLSNNIREMFEPVDEVPKGVPVDKGGTPETPKNAKDQAKTAEHGAEELVLTFAIRQPVILANQFACQNQLAYFHPHHRNPHTWPSHWHRFHPAHYLTNPYYRAQATQNFLYHSGLLTNPWRVKSNTRYVRNYPGIPPIRNLW